MTSPGSYRKHPGQPEAAEFDAREGGAVEQPVAAEKPAPVAHRWGGLAWGRGGWSGKGVTRG